MYCFVGHEVITIHEWIYTQNIPGKCVCIYVYMYVLYVPVLESAAVSVEVFVENLARGIHILRPTCLHIRKDTITSSELNF